MAGDARCVRVTKRGKCVEGVNEERRCTEWADERGRWTERTDDNEDNERGRCNEEIHVDESGSSTEGADEGGR